MASKKLIVKARPAGVARSLSNDVQMMGRKANPDTSNTPDQMGPGEGLRSTPLDSSGQPRLWQYRPGYNLPTGPGEGRISYATLRSISDLYDVARKCIEIRKDELCSLPWDITVREPDKRKKRILLDQKGDEIQKIKRRFDKPDLRHSFNSWLRKGLEDFFVLDALSLSTMRSLGGDVMGWRFLDGATIKPRIDLTGEIPFRPGVGYQQYLFGYPRYDFFEARDPMPYVDAVRRWRNGDGFVPDAAPGGTPNDVGGLKYPPGELRYRPRSTRNHTVYGFSHIESMLKHVNIALRWQLWEEAFWVEGNIPSALISVPEDWNQIQIEEFQAWWDAMISGDPGKQRSVRFIPGGSKFMDTQPALEHSTEFAQWLLTITLFIFDLNRSEVGLDPLNGEGLGGKGHADGMQDQNMRASLRPTAQWLKTEIFDPLIQEDLGYEDMEWTWPTLSQDNEREKAEVNQILLTTGQKSLDELLAEDGQEPVGIGRITMLGNQPYSEADLKKAMAKGFLGMQAEQQQQQAEHQAGLQKQQTEHQAGLQQTSAITQSHLSQQQAEHKSGLDKDQATHESELNQGEKAGKRPLRFAGKSAEAGAECPHGCDCGADCGPGCGCDCPTHHPEKAAVADLGRWERKALKSLKSGRGALVSFTSEEIDDPVVRVVQRGLQKAADPDEVKAVFVDAREIASLLVRKGGQGHWITIEQDGIETHIFITPSGAVTKGPKHLIGGNIAHLPPVSGSFKVTHHPEGHVPEGHDKHPDYAEHGGKRAGQPYARLHGGQQTRSPKEPTEPTPLTEEQTREGLYRSIDAAAGDAHVPEDIRDTRRKLLAKMRNLSAHNFSLTANGHMEKVDTWTTVEEGQWDMADAVQSQFDNLPEHVQRMFGAESGDIVILGRGADRNSLSRGVQEMIEQGYHGVYTWNNPSIHSAYVFPGAQQFGRKVVEKVLVHEVGHGIDLALGNAQGTPSDMSRSFYKRDFIRSLQPDFIAAYDANVNNKELDPYYRKCPEEMFAEGFQMFHRQPDALKRDVPEVYDVMAKIDKEIEDIVKQNTR